MAGADAASAVVAELRINIQDAVLDLGGLHGTCRLHGTLFAAVALVFIELRDILADDTEVVQIRLHAVIGASADCDFELMRQSYCAVAFIETMVDLLGEAEGIQKSVLTGGSFTGNDRADERTGSAGYEPFLSDEGLDLINFIIGKLSVPLLLKKPIAFTRFSSSALMVSVAMSCPPYYLFSSISVKVRPPSSTIVLV